MQAWAAGAVHALLYLFLLVQAVSGYVRVTTGGFPIEALRVLGIPPLLPKDEAVARVAETVHAGSALVLIALIAVHVGAAAYHGLVLRDGVVARMWPPLAGRRG
jgi:cytochrome b561